MIVLANQRASFFVQHVHENSSIFVICSARARRAQFVIVLANQRVSYLFSTGTIRGVVVRNSIVDLSSQAWFLLHQGGTEECFLFKSVFF